MSGGEITTSNWRLMWLSILTAECYLVGKQAAMDSCEISPRPLQCTSSVLKYSFALLGLGEIELQFPSVTVTFPGIAHLVAKHSTSHLFHQEPVAVMKFLGLFIHSLLRFWTWSFFSYLKKEKRTRFVNRACFRPRAVWRHRLISA